MHARPMPFAHAAALVLFALLACLPGPGRAAEIDLRDVERALVRDVCDRDLVLLGELPDHGEAVGFAIKARVVQALVERCGFDAVLFEAGMYDFVGVEQGIARGEATQAQLDAAIGGFWSGVELAEFRRWLLRRAARHGLVVGGIDDQTGVTSHHASAVLPGLVAARVPADEADGCRAAVSRNLEWTYDAVHRFDAAERTRLQACTRQAAASADAKDEAWPERAMVESLAHYVDRQARAPDALTRDRSMHRLLDGHRARLPAGSKVVVWTATTHAAREQAGIEWEPLGALLAQAGEGGMAAIGFTALAGESGRIGAPRMTLPALPAGSLEARALASGGAGRYLDARALAALDGAPSRLLGAPAAAAWSRLFDGVVVVREEHAPVFDDAHPPAE